MSDLIMETKDLTVSFGGLKAANHVNFALKKGEIHGLIGPNGAGKTTFFNILTGLYKPSEGEVVFNGKVIAGKKPWDIAKLGIRHLRPSDRILRRYLTETWCSHRDRFRWTL